MMFRHSEESLSEMLGRDGRKPSARTPDLFSSTAPRSPRIHDVYRLNPSDSMAIPHVVVPASLDLEDFFATVATYYQELAPISALTHVLDSTTQKLLAPLPSPRGERLLPVNSRSRIASVGIAVAEVTLSAIANSDSITASYAASKRTLAFALARSSILYGSALEPRPLASKWRRLQALSGLSTDSAIAEAVICAHDIAHAYPGRRPNGALHPRLDDALRIFASGDDERGQLIWQHLSASHPGISTHLTDLSGDFDKRLTAFTRAVEIIGNGASSSQEDDIAVGFMCNLILPGSFAHVGVLKNLVRTFSSATIWYGFFSFLSNFSFERGVSAGLVAKLERDLLSPFSLELRPRCDIALEELEVLSRTALRPELLRPGQQRALLVALAPGIDVSARFEPDVERSQAEQSASIEIGRAHERLEKLLREAASILDAMKPVAYVNRPQRKRPLRD